MRHAGLLLVIWTKLGSAMQIREINLLFSSRGMNEGIDSYELTSTELCILFM